ncbi:MAG: hypothetical protein WCE23_17295 [Candidatus Binatus sp.]|uniref:hypothetical protein n=1 Tax=Candidatus Binatus sp. TaxID=2811406 RepID=UPI003C74A135
MRHTLALAAFVFAATAALGCGAQQPNQSQPQPASASPPDSQLVIAPKVTDEPAHPLPFKGRLVAGNPTELPPAVAMSLSSTSPVTFTYREELTHDDYHVPLIVSALDPANLVGAPLGDIGTSAFASLSISDGDRILGDYTAKEHVSKSYNMYSHSTHKEVDDAARAAVRSRIDQKLYSDEARLADGVARAGKSPTAPVGQ